MDSSVIDRATTLLRDTQMADGHNDLAWALRKLSVFDDRAEQSGYVGPIDLDGVIPDLTVEQPDLQTDLVRLRRGRVGLQFWSVYVPCDHVGHTAVTAVLEQIELVHAMIARFPEHLALARTADEAEAAFLSGRIASMLGAEGGHCIADSLAVLRAFWRLGVRYLTLTHNNNTAWADSATDEPRHGGLTDFGEAVVRECNRIGMLVDLSHVAPATMRCALDTTTAPVVFSHSSCRAIADHPRNVPDDVLARLATNGGVCMITFVPQFVSADYANWDRLLREAMTEAGADHRDLAARHRFATAWRGPRRPEVTIDDVIPHIEHAREVAGIDHIGLGGDYDGVATQPAGLEDVSCYPALFALLLERGWSEQDCAKLAGRNVLRVLRDAETVAAAKAATVAVPPGRSAD